MAFTAGTIVTWLQNTEKFSMPSAAARSTVIAVDGVVVSKPMRHEHHAPPGIAPGDLQRVQRRVHHADVRARRLGVQQEPCPPGTRSMSPNEARMTPGWRAMWIASSTRPIGITHTGQPGPCTSETCSGR